MEGHVGWIHNGPVMGWNWMVGTQYSRNNMELHPVWCGDEWTTIVSDALAAILQLLLRVEALGGPEVPRELGGRRASNQAWYDSVGASAGPVAPARPRARRIVGPRPAPAPRESMVDRNRRNLLARRSAPLLNATKGVG